MTHSIAHLALLLGTIEPSGGTFPIGDWQFWVATLIAGGAVGWTLRAVVPWRRLIGRPRKKAGRRTTLTLHGVSVEGKGRGRGGSGGGGASCH